MALIEQRFLDAQANCWQQVITELTEGKKRTHWMWFVFPQIKGLGRSAMANRFAIASLSDAKSCLQHRGLGKRLNQATELVLNHSHSTLEEIFGYPDNLKFISSMTLFSLASGDANSVFHQALVVFNKGEYDSLTVSLIKSTHDN